MGQHDPFETLNHILGKYRRDVHRLSPPVPPDALASTEAHLGGRLPSGLRSFLLRHNGAELFRQSLRIHGVTEFKPAGSHAPGVTVFAESFDGTRWAFARDNDGEHAFGLWDGTVMQPLHATFGAWLDSGLEILDARVTREEDKHTIRLANSPSDPHQLFLAGSRALVEGRPEEAQPLLETCVRLDPVHPKAWQYLGDTLAGHDRTAARKAWLNAFHLTRLPLAWPGAPCPDPSLLTSLGRAFEQSESWESELERFLEERVHNVRSQAAFDFLVATAQALARSLAHRGRRERAREVLTELLARTPLFAISRPSWDATVQLTDLEIDLGMHDEAEQRIRAIRQDGPDHLQGTAATLLARIVVQRLEPWADEVLDEAEELVDHDDDRIRLGLWRVNKLMREGDFEQAGTWLTRVHELVRRGAPRSLQATERIVTGDLARLQGHIDDAREAWLEATEVLGDRPDPELALRLTVRRGDLALDHDDLDQAVQCYQQAVRRYGELELPLRAAWAMLRLARLSDEPEPLIQAARARFLKADMAAGVAITDAMLRQPQASLDWHIERATEHARSRQQAQRSRPPYTRQDADRPERRLGAHRAAVASGSEKIVHALAHTLDGCARAMEISHGRPLDPAVLRYTAAVHLLAGHRSYQAARILLDHLFQERVTGSARRALQGVVARTQNAALVDGLLQVIERPQTVHGAGLAAAAEALGLRRERAAYEPLLRLAQAKLPPHTKKAVLLALGRIGRRQAVEVLVPHLAEPLLAEATALALLMLGDRRGVDFHARALAQDDVRVVGQPGEIVGRYGGPDYLLVLTALAGGSDDPAAFTAIHGLGLLGDIRAIPHLLAALDLRHPKRAEIATGSLQILTGHQVDRDETHLQKLWTSWWEDNGADFTAGIRYRHGKVFGCGQLIDTMGSSVDSWTRRTAYDELVITSGYHTAFDTDGPWRTQQEHLKSWRRWWMGARHQLPAGRWYLDGKPID